MSSESKPMHCIDCGKEIATRRYLYIDSIPHGPRCAACHTTQKQELGIPVLPYELQALAAKHTGGTQ